MAIKSYRDLEVWKAAIDMVEMTYKIAADFPPDEKYGLKSQLQRSAVSVAANIAEGYGRAHRREYLNHLSIANGSLAEFETHLIIATRVKFVSRNYAKAIWAHAKRVGQMLRKLKESLSIDAVETRQTR
jgi:four helix bundle protein